MDFNPRSAIVSLIIDLRILLKGQEYCGVLLSGSWIRPRAHPNTNVQHNPHVKGSFIQRGKETKWLNLNQAEAAAESLASVNLKRGKGKVCVRMSWGALVSSGWLF